MIDNLKSVLITGAYGGMGRAASELFAECGFRVFAMDKRVGEAKENIIPIEADVTSEESLVSALELVKSKTDGLYAILHFAGVYMLDSLVEMSNEAFGHIFDVNVRGAFLVNKAFLSLLHDGSRILMVTSELATYDPLPFTGIYAVTKAALDKYAYSLAMELQLLGIKVSVLRAGAVKTGMLGVSTDHLDRFCDSTEHYSCNAARFKEIVGRVEARCIPPEEVAEKALSILRKSRPAFSYRINRNPLLVLLNILPKRMQMWAIKLVLKPGAEKNEREDG